MAQRVDRVAWIPRGSPEEGGTSGGPLGVGGNTRPGGGGSRVGKAARLLMEELAMDISPNTASSGSGESMVALKA